MLDLLDKYKYGIIAVFAAYMILFVYLQMSTYTQYFPIEPFHEGPRLEGVEELELTPDQIEVSTDFNQDIKNMSRDQNDQREKSMTDYTENQSAEQIEQNIKDLEKQMFEEAGGEQERQRIKEEMERQQALAEQKKKEETKEVAKTGGDKSYSGSVMVEWTLADRNPHKRDNWYVRNPGYTCGYGANGVVTVEIKVTQGGEVASVTYLPTQSSGANQCMIDQALKYAKMSRFQYSANAPKIQAGLITYRFQSQ